MDWPPTLLDQLLPGPLPSDRERMVRDLERLLNTRSPARAVDEADPEAMLTDFGIPAVVGEMLDSPERVACLCLLIEKKIERFEPRLVGVRVRSDGVAAGRLRLRIEARFAPLASPSCVAEAILWPDGYFALDPR